jgi:hypothetical protein
MNRVLAEVYAECRDGTPSPTRLTRLALRYALDSRRSFEVSINQVDLRPRNGFYEVQIYADEARRVPKIPFPHYVV